PLRYRATGTRGVGAEKAGGLSRPRSQPRGWICTDPSVPAAATVPGRGSATRAGSADCHRRVPRESLVRYRHYRFCSNRTEWCWKDFPKAPAATTLERIGCRHCRSEERRVGKVCRFQWSLYDYKNNLAYLDV